MSPEGGTLRATVWDPLNLGKISVSLQNFYASSVRVHLEEALIDAISKIVKLNKNGTQSLSNDIEALTALKIDELGDLERVKKYI